MTPSRLSADQAGKELCDRVRLLVEPFYRRDDPTAPDKLSHYTSLASAQNILASGEIRASDAFYLNDGSEVSYGAGLIAERLKGEPSILSRLHEHFDIAARSGPDSRILRSVRSLRMYVFSLSEKGDLLSQWRLMADREVALPSGLIARSYHHSVSMSRIRFHSRRYSR